MSLLWVFLGGGLGSVARHGVNLLAAQYVLTRYPLGTFCINVLGSLLIGSIAQTFTLNSALPINARYFLITGVLGGFTTFSAFSFEIGVLQQRGEAVAAVLYAIASVTCGVLAMFAGMAVVRHIVSD